jgi:hypothetical protein
MQREPMPMKPLAQNAEDSLGVAEVALSRRQAYRYLEEAAGLSRPAPIVEATVAVTFKLAPSLIGLIRARAVTEGTTISALVSRALRAFLGQAGGRG